MSDLAQIGALVVAAFAALAGGLGAWRWWTVAPSRAFWALCRSAQGLCLAYALLAGVLALMGFTPRSSLFWLYALLPLAVSFVGEQLRVLSAQTVLDARGCPTRRRSARSTPTVSARSCSPSSAARSASWRRPAWSSRSWRCGLPGPPRRARVERPVGPVVKDERLARAIVLARGHRADPDDVVAAVVEVAQLAGEPSDRAVEDRHAVRDAVRDGLELLGRRALGRERAREVLLIGGEDVDGEPSSRRDGRQRARRPVEADEQEDRLQGERGDRVRREPRGPVGSRQVTTVTPVGTWPMTCRKRSGSGAMEEDGQ